MPLCKLGQIGRGRLADEIPAHRLHNCEVVTRELAVGTWAGLLERARAS